MTDKQPKALRLADDLQSAVQTYPQMSEDEPGGYCRQEDALMDDAAAELRRLLAANIDCVAWYEAVKAQRDELLEAAATCRANFRRHDEETLKMAQAEDEERASLRNQRDELLQKLRGLVDALDATNWSSWQTTARFDPALNDARAAIAKTEIAS